MSVFEPSSARSLGNATVRVTTLESQPEILIARGTFGDPRRAFVNEVIEHLFGLEASGKQHEWSVIGEQPNTGKRRSSIPK